jgi:hypothetical protein
MFPLIIEPYLLYWIHTSFFDCEPCARRSTSGPCARRSTSGPCAPTVGLVPASFVIIIFLSYLTITPSTFGLSVGLISVLMPWYLNLSLSIGLVNCLTPCYLNLSLSIGLLNSLTPWYLNLQSFY